MKKKNGEASGVHPAVEGEPPAVPPAETPAGESEQVNELLKRAEEEKKEKEGEGEKPA